MSRLYVPIVKCKMGEQKALTNLADDIKDCIIPFIEIPYSPAMTKRSVSDTIASFWAERRFFAYFMPEWYEEYEKYDDFIIEQVVPLCNQGYVIPAIDLTVINEIEDWSILEKYDLAIRLRNNEFGEIEKALNTLFNEGKLKREQVYLLLDLQYVSNEDLFAKTTVLKTAFSDLDKVNEFKAIIVASVAFPKQLPQMESKKIYRFKRAEKEIDALALKLSERFNFNYLYADYGPSDIEEKAFVVGMSPNFKIKYTSVEDYLYIKGILVKKGGLDIGNVQSLARILIDSGEYCGEEYSWGDKCIYDIVQEISRNPGNLTTWVSYAMNHHITFIAKQI